MKNNFKDIFKILKKSFFFKNKFIYFIFKKNIFENNLSMFKRELPAEKDTMFYLYVTSHAKIFVSFCGILYARNA